MKSLLCAIVMILTFHICDSYAANPPTGNRPYLFITADRLTDMQDRQTADDEIWQLAKGRTDLFLIDPPYLFGEMASTMALIYNIDNTFTTHRDRAIELALDFAVDQSSGQYWGTTSTLYLSTLSNDISDTDTTITIEKTTGYEPPGVGSGWLAVGTELISYTGFSNGTLTGCTRGAAGTTASPHTAGEGTENVRRTFGHGDHIRWYSRYILYTYDWLYDSFTEQQRQSLRGKFTLWSKYWVNAMGSPMTGDTSEGTWSNDSDVLCAVAETLSLSAFCLYGDDAYSSELFDRADEMLALVSSKYLNGTMEGGIWGEGTNYSAYTMQLWSRVALSNLESRGIPYTQVISKYISDMVKGWWVLTYPGMTGILQYSDMEQTTSDYITLTGHNRLELVSTYEGIAQTNEEKELIRYWRSQATAIEGLTQTGSTYSGLIPLLFTVDTSSTPPTSETVPLDFRADGLNFHSMRTGWDDTADVVYIYGHADDYDHSHWTAGHFEINDGGVPITKENTGYYYGALVGETYAHNCLTIDGQDAGYGSHQGAYTVGDAEIDFFDHNSKYGFVQHDLSPLFNRDGYISENPIDAYTRRFMYLKEAKLLVVFDRLDISSESDCSWNGSNHLGINLPCGPRWTKLYQHFQSEPTLSGGTYAATNEGKTFLYHPVLPVNGTRTIINESTTDPWASMPTSVLPATQRRWNLMQEPLTASLDETFLNVMHWGNTGTTLGDVISIDTGDMVGAHISDTKDYVTLMSKSAGGSAYGGVITYDYDQTLPSEHYISNVTGSGTYNVNVTGTTSKTVTVDPSGDTYIASNDGVIAFSVALSDNAITQINTPGTGTAPSVSITTQPQTVPNATESINITGTTANATTVTCDPTATNTGTVDAFTFENVPLNVGVNIITVTASDGSTDATYNVTITRESAPQPTTGTSFKGATLKGVTIP